jgi:general L-amino acid transport system permease protein
LHHQYRGERPFSEWLKLHFVPFVETLGNGLIWLIILAIVGYVAALLVERMGGGTLMARQFSVRMSAWGWFLLPFIIFFLIFRTEVNQWGGLFLTFMLAGVGIVASFPLGVLLALGRRADSLPAIQVTSIMFIEGVRGVPLITVLYLSNLALPLVSPSLANVPNAVRAMVAITLFSAAYLAENVRGGLQSLPPGQTEAAKALGLNAVQVTLFITLPQALRAVIPALVGQFISLFKDTSLVAIVGLLELTSVALSVTAQAEYDGQLREAFLFISIIYFVFSYAMSYASQKLETSGSGAVMRAQEAA